ncbi:MAG: haloalkane dehalogenase [Rhodospirillaceae bacterium]|nr:haloalkane dehalogenase [Rhodospirillaceae bacterium]
MESRVLRTPEARFGALPDFPFPRRSVDIADKIFGGLRMAYVDEGPRGQPVVLMLHGEPTWSFLYRKMIGPIAAAGFRAVAPDHIGFGASDKPSDRAAYTYQSHVDWLRRFIEKLDLTRITLVCQDWGGPIGLRVLSEMVDRFDAVVAANTLLPNFEPPPRGIPEWPGAGIAAWGQSTKTATDMNIGGTVAGVCVTPLPAAVVAAYDAPFPDPSYKAGPIEFPALIPITPDMPGVAENRRAWEVLGRFNKPFVTAFSDGDPATKAWEKVFQDGVPGAKNQPHVEIKGAGHFLQEEKGEALADVVVGVLKRLYR